MLDESVVTAELRKFSSDPVKVSINKILKPQTNNSESPSTKQAGEVILRMIWHECDMLDYVLELIPKEAFDKVHAEIIGYVEKCLQNDELPDDMTAENFLSKAAVTEISRILMNGSEDPRADEVAAFEESVHAIKKSWLKKLYNERLMEASEYMSSDYPVYVEKVQETLKIKKRIDEL